MRQEEIIRLDARVVGVIANAVFRAELGNGHSIVAFAERGDRDRCATLQPGAVINVRMSPFDMSRGVISFSEEARAKT